MANSAVEWSFVDYGGENFYVASYRRPDEAPLKAAVQADEPVQDEDCRWTHCFPILRCWASSRQARKAA